MQEQAARKKIITKIEANPLLFKQNNENAILRVAAYCRVSTDNEDQLESYKAQVAHYTDAIAKNPRWRFVDIYADEGITGTMTKKRDNFNRMIRDCDKGKIDLILTKSVARFARNTVDSLNYVRRLRAKGIGVYFEEQCLDSLKADSEMFIGLHSVLAQAESENISANVRWGIQQRMKSGTFKFRYNLLGYKRGEDGEPEIVEEEARHIRKIYEMYLDGKSLDQIKAYLESKGVLTVTGKTEWSKTNIKNILSNERYSGDMLLQKTYIENCITKKVKKNRGEMAKYLITNNHPAIIDRETYKLVQMETARRGSKRKLTESTITQQGKFSGKYALSELLVCGECGSPYRRRIWAKYGKKKAVWRCVSRLEHGTTYCKDSLTVDENLLHSVICRALNRAVDNKDELFDLILSNLSYAMTGDEDTLDLYSIEQQLKDLERKMDTAAVLQATTSGDKSKYEQEIIKISESIVALRNQRELVKTRMSANVTLSAELERIKRFFECGNISGYDDAMVRRIVDYIRVMNDGKIVIAMKGGYTIEEELR